MQRNLLAGWRETLDFTFPWRCSLCGSGRHEPEGATSDERPVAESYCNLCIQRLSPHIANSCQLCGAAVGLYVSTDKGCVHCRQRSLKFKSVTCLGMYENALRTAILAAKWSYSAVGMQALARLLLVQSASELRGLQPDIVIPIPQSWQARMVRRFNAAERIAAVIADNLAIPSDQHVLCRRRGTRPQKRVLVNRRFDNQRGAFRIQDAHVIRNANVLLVDDVLTTGATCSEAAKMLKASGAKSCHVAVIARVLDHTA